MNRRPSTSSWKGDDYTDSITVARPTARGKVITVTMHGTNDAAVITGTSTAALTETNAAQSIGGDLNATDVDSAATFVAQTNVAGGHGYGKFSIDAAGTWTYTMNSAHDEFVGGQDYTDSITVKTADGTRKGHHRHHARQQRRYHSPNSDDYL